MHKDMTNNSEITHVETAFMPSPLAVSHMFIKNIIFIKI
jgi:hypothetical protein